jgi:hypothetical protein
VVQFLFALSLFLGVVTLTMLRFSRGAKGPTNVRRHVLLLGTLFELGLAGLLGLFISDGPSPERIPWFLVSVLVVVAGLAALIWTMATEDWASSPCGPTPSS